MPIQLTTISKKDFLSLFYKHPAEFKTRIQSPEIFVVKNFYPANEILAMRERVWSTGQNSEPSWHPLFDECPDYHRIHDNYEKAYVKGKIHVFYHHGFKPENHELFNYFHEIFEMKDFLAGSYTVGARRHLPSQGIIARVNFHHYPSGGGYQAEHIDPSGQHAQIQTLVVCSKFGIEFSQGGVYAKESEESEPIYVDSSTEPGDLLVLSPAIRHGVAPIDPEKPLKWDDPTGRWMILPIYVWSDYPHPENIKPFEVK